MSENVEGRLASKLLGMSEDFNEPIRSFLRKCAKRIASLEAQLAECQDWRDNIWRDFQLQLTETKAQLAEREKELWEAFEARDVLFDEHGSELETPVEVVRFLMRLIKTKSAEVARLSAHLTAARAAIERISVKVNMEAPKAETLAIIRKALADLPVGSEASAWRPIERLDEPADAITIAQRGFERWKAKPHNAKWFARIDGTPIPNDLIVCIAEAFMPFLPPPPATET